MRLNRLVLALASLMVFLAACSGGGGSGSSSTIPMSPSPSASATPSGSPIASPTPTGSPRATVTPSATPSGVATSSVSTSANAPGVFISGSTVTIYVPLGSDSVNAANVKAVTVASNGVINSRNTPGPMTISTTIGGSSGRANSCAGGSRSIICSEQSSDGVYLISPGAATATVLLNNPSNQAIGNNYSAGSCVECGAMIDPGLNIGIVSGGNGAGTPSANPSVGGFAVVNLATNTVAPWITTNGEPVSVNFGYDPVRHRILSPNYAVNPATNFTSTPAHFQIVTLNGNTGTVYDLANDQAFFNTNGRNCNATTPADILPDSGAIDTLTQIAIVTLRKPTACNTATSGPIADVALFDLSQATFTPPSGGAATGSWNTNGKQILTLSALYPNFGNGVTGISVVSAFHMALLADQSGNSGFGALVLPSSSGTGTPAVTDYVVASMPADPSGAPWAMSTQPNGLTTYIDPTTNRPMGVIMNASRTYLAVIDMMNLLNPANRNGPNSVPNPIPAGIVSFVQD